MSNPGADIEIYRKRVDDRLSGLVTRSEPGDLYEPVQYVLAGGGKRLRPIIVLLAAEGFGVEAEVAMPAALAVEVFHNFTLVHDDIMDHSDERRGRATVHARWSEDVAILAGDYLMALSYRLLSESPAHLLPDLLSIFHEMVAQLCEGQTLDKAFESRHDVTVDDYFVMIDAKTGALLRTCLELGAILGSATEAERFAIREAGTLVGRAFQIQDDLLDVVAQDSRWGKPVGGDLIEGKRTYLLLRSLTLPEGEQRKWFQRIMDRNGLEPELVDEARSRMLKAGVIDEARSEVLRLTNIARDRLLSLPGRSMVRIATLFDSMVSRQH